ncbi:MAG: methylmalonyl-CoA mutase family protein, partial [Nitrospinota bacterium]
MQRDTPRKDDAPHRTIRTPSGFEVAPCYGPEDIPPQHAQELAPAGEYPFTRGIHSTMYRGRLWTMRQYSGFGTAEDTNARYRFLLDQGNTGLSVALDLPTQVGLDSDDPRAFGEVGKVGVAIDTLDDMETLFRGIPL